MGILLTFFTVIVVGWLWPGDLFAWGPATHLKLGLTLLDNLKILTQDVASLISNNTVQFLYGCISADIIQAKKFLRYVENCHNWANGFKLLRSAKSQPLRAFAMGYLAHLASDIIAHNCFVPAKMVETYPKKGIKHFVWEMRFDAEMNDQKVEEVMAEIIKMDHREEDELMNDLLDTLLFSFKTNKRIFSGLLLIQRVRRWQDTLSDIYLRNNYLLTREEVDYYSGLSMDAIYSFLIDGKESKYVKYDPTGKNSLSKAVRIMRDLNRKEREGRIVLADQRTATESIAYFRRDFLK